MKEPAIDNKELILALEELEKEKGMKKEYLLEAIETALVTAYKRNFDSLENVKVVMDRQTGATHVYSVKEVVAEVENSEVQISVEDVQKRGKVSQTLIDKMKEMGILKDLPDSNQLSLF